MLNVSVRYQHFDAEGGTYEFAYEDVQRSCGESKIC